MNNMEDFDVDRYNDTCDGMHLSKTEKWVLVLIMLLIALCAVWAFNTDKGQQAAIVATDTTSALVPPDTTVADTSAVTLITGSRTVTDSTKANPF